MSEKLCSWPSGIHSMQNGACTRCGAIDTPKLGWTLAYRNKRANRFLRVSDWAGTWAEARDTAARATEAHPELEIWYTPSLEAERNGKVCAEDCGNILVDSGRRVRIAEGGKIADLVSVVGLLPSNDRRAWGYVRNS